MKIIMSNSQINGIVSSSFANDYALAVADFTRYAIILFGCCCGCCCCFLRLFNRSICWLVIRIFGLDNMCFFFYLIRISRRIFRSRQTDRYNNSWMDSKETVWIHLINCDMASMFVIFFAFLHFRFSSVNDSVNWTGKQQSVYELQAQPFLLSRPLRSLDFLAQL